MTTTVETLNDFVIDDSVKQVIEFSIQAAKKRKEPLKHILLSGAGGLGKSTLAYLIYKKYNQSGSFVTLYGPSIQNNFSLIKVILSLKDGDVLFIDEVHAIKDKTIIENLYSVIQDHIINIRTNGSYIRKPVKNFTFIVATTDLFKLTDSFIGRFPIKIDILPYNIDQLSTMINFYSDMKLTEEASRKIAEISRGVARNAVENTGMIDLYASSKDLKTVNLDDVIACFKLLNIDSNGLNKIQREYLELLNDHLGESLSLNIISRILNKPTGEVTRFIEPVLLSMGFIEIGGKGRSITQKGSDIAEEG